jgi:hypothetical protein
MDVPVADRQVEEPVLLEEPLLAYFLQLLLAPRKH